MLSFLDRNNETLKNTAVILAYESLELFDLGERSWEK